MLKKFQNFQKPEKFNKTDIKKVFALTISMKIHLILSNGVDRTMLVDNI